MTWTDTHPIVLRCVCGWERACPDDAGLLAVAKSAHYRHMRACPECIGPTKQPKRPHELDQEAARTYDAHTKADLWAALRWAIWTRTVGETSSRQECQDRTLERMRTALGQVRDV